MSRRPGPAPRDTAESEFSRILERFWKAHPTLLSAAFVDEEGECIDYFSSLDPFEAKVAGAQLVAMAAALGAPLERSGLRDPRVWVVEADRRDLVLARASGEYAVVLVLESRGVTARLLEALDPLVEALSREAGLRLGGTRRVEVRMGVDPWGVSRPVAVRAGESVVPILQVQGCWTERGAITERRRTCYRVRLPGGERTLVHDASLDSWRIRGPGVVSWPPESLPSEE